uniref:Potassium channel domain-containing protein n=1 Tax=Meloidogyne javanica TaxID=6303 RepID=A0A915N1J5_MELJA
MAKREELIERLKCVERNLKSEKIEVENGGEEEKHLAAKLIANRIVAGCVLSQVRDERMEWNLKNAALFGFGILTTLGYGKIEPRTTQGRLFTVFYGFLGVPFTFLGAILIDWLDEQVDFPNGIYFAFLCLTAIEYGKLIPSEVIYLPIVIVYICFGLAISTIALDIGSTYVKKLYYLGRKIRNIASIKICLRVRELLVALGQNIGLEPANAIQVKEGRLNRVPQTHMIMDGIWPPELVPLFLRDGQFPEW